MLLNDFFKITSLNKEDGTDKVTIEINPQHKIFDGHFPGQPVVPGVCLIQSLKEVIEQIEHRKLLLHEASNIKFLAVIDPNIDKVVDFDISITENDQDLSVKCVASWNEKVCLKFAGRLK